jgi:hypothetical protein
MIKISAVSSSILLALLACATPVVAQKPAAPPPTPAAPPMPAPSKELAAFMQGLEGSWRCDTKFPAGAMGPGSPEGAAKATVVIKKDFGGMSWHSEVDVQPSNTTPALKAVVQIGWDPGTRQATLVSYDSMGAAVLGIGRLSNESVTFLQEGYMMGMKFKGRETMTKRGPKEFFHKWEVDLGQGFQSIGEDTCKR